MPDVREAARRHSALFGSGPFLTVDNMKPACWYRDREQPIDMSIALGQWGGQIVELIQQNDNFPSVTTISIRSAAAVPACTMSRSSSTIWNGHFTEIYQSIPQILGAYQAVAAAALGFDGRDPVRPMIPGRAHHSRQHL